MRGSVLKCLHNFFCSLHNLFQVVFALTLACAYAYGAGNSKVYLDDTPEVAQAKLAHFTEKAKAAAAVGAAPDYYTAYYLNYYKNLNAAPVTVLPNGFLAETAEVAAAKAAFLAEYAKAAAAAGPAPASIPTPVYYNDFYKSYLGYNPAQITVLPNGFLADTPEVAAAKASFQAEYNRALYSSA